MPSTFFGLTITTSGLYAANAGMNTTAHNMSNENTKGYCRQVVEQTASEAIKVYQSYGMAGAGVTVTNIAQVRDLYYDEKYWINNSNMGEQNAKDIYNIQIEDYFNELNTGGFTDEYEDLFNTLKELQGNSEETALRLELLNYAQSIADYFNDIQTKLSNLQQECNTEVSNLVDQINSFSDQIAALTKQISTVEMNGGYANDLRDKRALLIDGLSELVPVTVKERINANNQLEYTVKVDGYTLVDCFHTNHLKVVAREDRKTETDVVGLYDVYYNYDERTGKGLKFDVQAMRLTGELRGVLDIRDGDNGTNVFYKGIPHYMKRVRDFEIAFSDLFNNTHKEGYNLYGDKTENIDFYVMTEDGKMMVNEELLKDPKLLATSATPIHEGIADAGIVEKWIALQDKTVLQNASANEYLQSIVSEIAVSKKKCNTMYSNYEKIQQNIKNQRLSVSGVDGDEETMNLVKYQEAYELSAKMLQTMSEMLDRLITQTGV